MMPGPMEAVAIAHAHKLFDAWVKGQAGTPQFWSNSPDRRSFQAGYIQALIEYGPQLDKLVDLQRGNT